MVEEGGADITTCSRVPKGCIVVSIGYEQRNWESIEFRLRVLGVKE